MPPWLFDDRECTVKTASEISTFLSGWYEDDNLGPDWHGGISLVEYPRSTETVSKQANEVNFVLSLEDDNSVLLGIKSLGNWEPGNEGKIQASIQEEVKREVQRRGMLGKKIDSVQIALAFSPEAVVGDVVGLSEFVTKSGYKVGYVFSLPVKTIPEIVLARHGFEPSRPLTGENKEQMAERFAKEEAIRLGKFTPGGPALPTCDKMKWLFGEQIRKKDPDLPGPLWVECGCEGSIDGFVLHTIPHERLLIIVKNVDNFDEKTFVISSKTSTWADLAPQLFLDD